ncbi:MAG: ATP-dependent DNA helicase [Minwuiales bacterium]|nr:ATP-dependent DNA helicase [Minwuiales bacterium]
MPSDSAASPRTVRLPEVPALAVGGGSAAWLTPDGELLEVGPAEAARLARDAAPMVCHAPATAARLGVNRFPAHDLLDLFAFARPAQFCLPTIVGLADALGLDRPHDRADEAMLLVAAAERLLTDLTREKGRPRGDAAALAMTMARAGWPWGPAAVAALGEPAGKSGSYGGLDVWNRLKEWDDRAPTPPPEDAPVSPAEARERLGRLLDDSSEERPAQAAFTEAAAGSFAPREHAGEPQVVLAEAGTGVGKTLGYIAPASVWAEKNGGAVWLSTFTKNLQRQIDQELDRLYPDPAAKAEKVVVRKGRENYLCLLNVEEATQGGAARQSDQVALGLMARWAEASRDGDMGGGDFPSWLSMLYGPARTTGLTDRRGECIYSACPHYRKCFIEKSRHKAERAEIVIANHALVMIRAAWHVEQAELPLRYVFDEGHHLFGAADSAFSANISGLETADLRRWIRGGEGGRRSRARGLEKRIGDLVADNEEAERAMNAAVAAAAGLAAEGWLKRLVEGEPFGPTERFLALVRQQVYARAPDRERTYGLETSTEEPVAGLLEAARGLDDALGDLLEPVTALQKVLLQMLDDEAADLDTASRVRVEAAASGLERRARVPLQAWRAMLRDLKGETPEQFVDWFSVDRIAGNESDVGYHRHWVDPTLPFTETVLRPAHGALITSATLLDHSDGDADDWAAAEVRTGVTHLVQPAARVSLPSPFDHAQRTRVFVVTDVRRDNPDQVAAAYRELFLAAGGGALGLFTAIWRLRAVQKRLAEPLDAAGLALYAQHVDAIDTPTLVDIFRAEEDSCLLGTDAVRDGVDVPGRSLRLIVFDRVPWPRPDILHRARKQRFGRSAYDDMLTRLKLKQAYGRLLRRAEDDGVFVMLDAMLPSRLLTAFPAEVEVNRVGLAEAVAETRAFLTDRKAAGRAAN